MSIFAFNENLSKRDPAIQLTRKRLGIDIEITVEATKLFTPIKSSLEDRIRFTEPEEEEDGDNNGGSASTQVLSAIALLAIFFI